MWKFREIWMQVNITEASLFCWDVYVERNIESYKEIRGSFWNYKMWIIDVELIYVELLKVKYSNFTSF